MQQLHVGSTAAAEFPPRCVITRQEVTPDLQEVILSWTSVVGTDSCSRNSLPPVASDAALAMKQILLFITATPQKTFLLLAKRLPDPEREPNRPGPFTANIYIL